MKQYRPYIYSARFALAIAVTACASFTAMAEHFVPCGQSQILGSIHPGDAQSIAVRSFTRAVVRITGESIPQSWDGTVSEGRTSIHAGNADTIPALLAPLNLSAVSTDDVERRNQSYVVAAISDGGIIAAGLGEGESPRAFLGLGYALGELLRRLEQREGQWGFALPDEPIVGTPSMPDRTLYLMNSDHMNPGLSLEYFSEQELEVYVDFLIEARYSRVSLWQWTANMLYPGNFEQNRPRNEMTHRAMRHLFGYARQRGLQVYHQLAPMHANVDLLPPDPKFTATGY